MRGLEGSSGALVAVASRQHYGGVTAGKPRPFDSVCACFRRHGQSVFRRELRPKWCVFLNVRGVRLLNVLVMWLPGASGYSVATVCTIQEIHIVLLVLCADVFFDVPLLVFYPLSSSTLSFLPVLSALRAG